MITRTARNDGGDPGGGRPSPVYTLVMIPECSGPWTIQDRLALASPHLHNQDTFRRFQ